MEDDNPTSQSPSTLAGPRRYMSKTQRACDFCRSRKSACRIDTAPPCQLCKGHGRPCEFTSRLIRRGRPNQRERLRGALSQTRSDDIESDNNHDSVHGVFTTPLERPEDLSFGSVINDSPEFPSSGTGGPSLGLDLDRSLEELNSSYLTPGDQEVMDQLMLSICEGQSLPRMGNDATDEPDRLLLDSQKSMSLQLCGLTSDMDPYVLQHYQFDRNAEFPFSKLTIRAVQDVDMPVQFLLSKPDLSVSSKAQTKLGSERDTGLSSELLSLVTPEVGERLIQLFLQFINPQFPIFSKAKIPTPLEAPIYLLAGIYLITQPFATFDEYLCIELAYSPPAPHLLFGIAWKALNEALSDPTIATVQAALILLLQPSSNPLILDSALKWSLLGMTVSMAHTLGLHLDPSAWNLPQDEIKIRRCLSWNVFALDKWLAFSFGRPSHITENNWMVTELRVEDLANSVGLGDNYLFAMAFSKLTVILGTVLTDLYSLRSISTLTRNFSLTISKARPIMHDLMQWYAELPPALMLDRTDTGREINADSSASLHIAYQSVKILILRALLRPFNNSGHQVESHEQNAANKQIRQVASVEAEAAVRVVLSLRPVHYQAFWAPWTKTCFALITHLLFLLAVTAYRNQAAFQTPRGVENQPTRAPEEPDLIDEYANCRAALDRARAIFRLHAKSLDVIRLALLRIDAVFWIGWEKVVGFP